MHQTSTKVNFTLPAVVQLGFSGSRALFEGVLTDSPHALQLCAEFKPWLDWRLERLRKELNLDDNQFLVGISQLACGADMLFTKYCRSQSIPQRFFLPENRYDFLNAVEPDGTPDFTPFQRAEAETLFESEHVIQERVVCNSPDRSSRFVESNLEILRVSDAMVCVLRADSVGKIGGTRQLLKRAIVRGVPVLEIQVAEQAGRFVVVVDKWHNLPNETGRPIQNFPEFLGQLSYPKFVSGQNPIPKRNEFCEKLMNLATRHAANRQRLFRRGAVVIIGTHVLATVLATGVLAIPHSENHSYDTHSFDWLTWGMVGVLSVELVLLVLGYFVHWLLHHSRAVQDWASARFVCELVRSVDAIGSRHLYLTHLYRISIPIAWRPLLRTLSVVHLNSTWPHRNQPWQAMRDQYIHHRFDDPKHGQLKFFEESLERDRRLMWRCQTIFSLFSIYAMLATAAKILMLSYHFDNHVLPVVIGFFAVTLPVIAVAGLSWAAAIDCEARVETFEETLRFLRRQRPYLEQADSAFEFDQLLMETEAVLLGEISSWYSRRTTKGVS